MGRHAIDVLWPEETVPSRDFVIWTPLGFYRTGSKSEYLGGMLDTLGVQHRDLSVLVDFQPNKCWIDGNGNMQRRTGTVLHPMRDELIVHGGEQWRTRDGDW